MSIKLSANEIRYIALFENMTGAMVKDCIIDDEHGKVTFVVKNGDMGLAIGKGGNSVSKVQRAVDKSVEVIELSEDPIQFIKNILSPAKLQSVKLHQKTTNRQPGRGRNIPRMPMSVPLLTVLPKIDPRQIGRAHV